MRVISVNVRMPKNVTMLGVTFPVQTAIWKSTVEGPVAVRQHNLAGDQQADLRVHGGPNKAVYAYPSEHYEFWRSELPGADLGWAAFGENLTTQGLLETDVRVGDELSIGTAVLRVTQPRLPFRAKGNSRFPFGRKRLPRSFNGLYFSRSQPSAHLFPREVDPCSA